MRLFRMLISLLTRNEDLINKLADSRPIRRSARFVAHLIFHAKAHGPPLTFKREELLKLFRKYKEKFKQIKDDTKKNSPQ